MKWQILVRWWFDITREFRIRHANAQQICHKQNTAATNDAAQFLKQKTPGT